MTSPTEFRLRECRERAGMSVEELARLTGLDQHPQRNRLQTFESGICTPDLNEATDIAIALGCSLDELAGIEAPKLAIQEITDRGPVEWPTEAELSQMMRDPRYWRDRDPEWIERVTAGFRKLYPA